VKSGEEECLIWVCSRRKPVCWAEKKGETLVHEYARHKKEDVRFNLDLGFYVPKDEIRSRKEE
jgi:hypothetical protein